MNNSNTSFDFKKILIIGQGISGTFLSYFFYKAGVDFIVIDDAQTNASSRVAAGLINPVTGRRVVKVWMDNLLIPFAERAYEEIGDFLKVHAIDKKSIINFFPNAFMKESFQKKLNLKEDYIDIVKDENFLKEYFNYELGAGKIFPAYAVHLRNILPAWKKFLKNQNQFLEEKFDVEELKITNEKIIYKNIEADKIIFCDGARGINNPFFGQLPFALNKGEAITIEAPDLPHDFIYKKSFTLVPLPDKGFFWVGTNYIWDFKDDLPSIEYKTSVEQTLKNWLKVPFKMVDHKAAIRPATSERRPFAGFHPVHKNVGILNGFGTKGCSLAPYFAHRLFENILYQTPIEKEADVKRFMNDEL
jgi:glycine/D-amino acid oxidase-like deaminating enzyme